MKTTVDCINEKYKYIPYETSNQKTRTDPIARWTFSSYLPSEDINSLQSWAFVKQNGRAVQRGEIARYFIGASEVTKETRIVLWSLPGNPVKDLPLRLTLFSPDTTTYFKTLQLVFKQMPFTKHIPANLCVYFANTFLPLLQVKVLINC